MESIVQGVDNRTIVFYGAGKVGREALVVFNRHTSGPDYFCDSNVEKIGKDIEGIQIISLSTALQLSNPIFVITCFSESEVERILLSNGVCSDHIVTGFVKYSRRFLDFLYERDNLHRNINRSVNDTKCLFDFNYGACLGGVEYWCYSQAEIMLANSIDCIFLGPNIYDETKKENLKYDCVKPKFAETHYEYVNTYNWIEAYIDYLVNSDAGVVIVNFPRDIMHAVTVVKEYYKKDIKTVFVIHNDEDIYYEKYAECRDLIDYWFIISGKIRYRVETMGVDRHKIHRLFWKVKTADIERKYETLRVGYAGRINIQQKRVDLIIKVAEFLHEKKIDFHMQLAGIGNDVEYLTEQIKDKNLSQCIEYVGLIPHEKIMDFWTEQSICIACSDYEGHSISVYESMACGAVPVVTDVSGARDDITDGVNGFILPIGDVAGIADKIEKLSNNHELLGTMSRSCVEYVKRHNLSIAEEKTWKDIIGISK